MSETLVKNASNAKQVKEAEIKERFGRRGELEDVAFILSSVQGRRVFWRYLSLCGVFQSSFTGNSHTFFKEGERNVGLKLLVDINEADPESYLKMLKESRENEK